MGGCVSREATTGTVESSREATSTGIVESESPREGSAHGELELLLHDACDTQNWEATRMLIRLNPDGARAHNRIGELPIHRACQKAAPLDLVHLLINAYPESVRVPAPSEAGGRLVLHYVAESTENVSMDMFQLLLQLHPDAVRVADGHGMLPLHYACVHSSSLDRIRILVQADPLTLLRKTSEGKTALLLAYSVTDGNEETKRFLLEQQEQVVQAHQEAVEFAAGKRLGFPDLVVEHIWDFAQPHVWSKLPKIAETLKDASASQKVRLNAVRSVRRMLSVDDPPVEQIVDCGIPKQLVGATLCDDDPSLQFEAAWALTNVASTSYTNVVVEEGAISPMVRLLESPYTDARDQAAWCLGNIAGDGPEYRDQVLQTSALPSLLNIIHSCDKNLDTVSNAVWTVSNLCRFKPPPEFALLRDCIPTLAFVISHPNRTKDTIIDAAWAFAYLGEADDSKLELLPIVPLMIPLLTKRSTITPTLRALSSLVSGPAQSTQAVLDAGLLEHASKLLKSPSKEVRQVTCFVLSNIALGTNEQINLLLDTPDVMSLVIDYARSTESEVRKEAIWTLSNVFISGDNGQVQRLVDLEGIKILCEALTLNDTKLITIVLEALEALLKAGYSCGRDYRLFVIDSGGVDNLTNIRIKLKARQLQPNDDIYYILARVCNTFCNEVVRNEEDLAHATA